MFAFKYKLKPTKSQISEFKKQLEVHCFTYNLALKEKQSFYEQKKENLSCFDQIKSVIPRIDRGTCNCSSLQQTIRRLHKSYQAFFDKNSKPPKNKEFFTSIEFSKHGDGWKIKNNQLYIQGLNSLDVIWHKPILGDPQRLILKIDKDNNIFASIVTDYTPIIPANKSSFSVGLDFGLKTFITTSDGEEINHPLPYKKSLKKLRKIERQLKKVKAQQNKIKIGKKSKAKRKLHKKTSNQRKDFLHKLSHSFVQTYGFIAIEDLKIEKLNSFKNINRKYRDVAWNEFTNFLNYKARNAGVVLKKVPAYFTSQDCSACGKRVEKKLSERQHVCSCGYSDSRDRNAAKNILKKAQFSSGITELGRSLLGSPGLSA